MASHSSARGADHGVIELEVPEHPEQLSVNEAVDQYRSEVEAHSPSLYLAVIV